MMKLSVDVVDVLSILKRFDKEILGVQVSLFGFWFGSKSIDRENPQLSRQLGISGMLPVVKGLKTTV